jgi:hypothetical protein
MLSKEEAEKKKERDMTLQEVKIVRQSLRDIKQGKFKDLRV